MGFLMIIIHDIGISSLNETILYSAKYQSLLVYRVTCFLSFLPVQGLRRQNYHDHYLVFEKQHQCQNLYFRYMQDILLLIIVYLAGIYRSIRSSHDTPAPSFVSCATKHC
jgi:hypothetical protein